MLKSIREITTSAVKVISAFMGIVLTLLVAMGVITTEPSKDDPIKYSKNGCKMSAVLLSDIHMRDTAIQPNLLKKAFKDVANGEYIPDAFVEAGDLAEIAGDQGYAVSWELIEDSVFYKNNKAILLATGNHDIRIEYEARTKLFEEMNSKYNNITVDKPYFSYMVNGYKFIIMGSDAWQLEKAVISDEQLAFLDKELSECEDKPTFVVCHQPLANTHGLPEVWKNGDLGPQSEAVKEVLMKHKNVYYICGHLHDGIYEKALECFDYKNGVYSIALPSFGKDNDYGKFNQQGLGVIIEAYDNEVIFKARDFVEGKNLSSDTYGSYSYSFPIVK